MKKYYQLSSSKVNQLYLKNGVLLLLQAPQGIQLGIDNISWRVGSKFKGIKFIPLGAHIISYSLKEQNNMFKITQFINFTEQHKIQAFKWNDYYKMFIQAKGEEAEQYKQSVKRMHYDCYLGPYPQENYKFWKQNTSHITKKVLDKLDPQKKINRFDEEYGKPKQKQKQQLLVEVDQDEPEQIIQQYQTEQMAQQQEQQNKDSKKKQGNDKRSHNEVNKFQSLTDTINYSEIVRKLSNDPTQINRINIDKTEILDYIIKKQWNNESINLLGELQYSFIYFLIGEDLQSFQQWKKIIHLIVFSETAYLKPQLNSLISQNKQKTNKNEHEKLVLQFIVTFYSQLQQFPVDFFIDEISKTSFLRQIVKRLKQYEADIYQCISQKIKIRLRKLFKFLQTNFYESTILYHQEIQSEDMPITVQEQPTYF